ncbi:MAG: hypothetical protein ACRD04_14600 [Terriglobales bacterium]
MDPRLPSLLLDGLSVAGAAIASAATGASFGELLPRVMLTPAQRESLCAAVMAVAGDHATFLRRHRAAIELAVVLLAVEAPHVAGALAAREARMADAGQPAQALTALEAGAAVGLILMPFIILAIVLIKQSHPKGALYAK